jgi:fumarylacetoacetate (FAA) hydrolase family protein
MARNHQYPDGAMLFLGTMFAPTDDRLEPGKGFTHVVGDVVTITSPKLGALVNRVNYCDKIPPWSFGAVALMKNLAERRLIS